MALADWLWLGIVLLALCVAFYWWGMYRVSIQHATRVHVHLYLPTGMECMGSCSVEQAIAFGELVDSLHKAGIPASAAYACADKGSSELLQKRFKNRAEVIKTKVEA